MKVTIEEAKQKWCPYVNFLIGPSNTTWQDRAFNNRGDVFEPAKCTCVATDCMMFEEVGTRTDWIQDDSGQDTIPEEVNIFRCGLSR